MRELAEMLKSEYVELLEDKKLMSGIYMVTLVTALLILALVIKGPEKSGKLIADESGSIVGIHRAHTDRTERYDLALEISNAGNLIERNVTLVLQANRDNKIDPGMSKDEKREAEISAEIDTMINEIEYSKGAKIDLPVSLSDGTSLIWKSIGQNKTAGSLIYVIPLFYMTLLALMIASRIKKDKSKDEERKSIIKGLPRFCNQLFLMMNAGLILSDAFDTITGSYAAYKEEDLSPFERDLAELRNATDEHRVSTARVISEYASKREIKELIRIATILTENEKRGSDVIESLERESRYLWDERKIVARESGKMIDTKMAYPLGLLLIILIVITMAPALLSM